jgi:hypothetical protein
MTMAANVESGRRGGIPWRLLGWGIAAILILLPLVAMQFTSEVNWTPADFIFAIVMIGTVGLVFELAVRMSSNWAWRAGAACALAAGFLLVWINGAVGMIGSEGNPNNLLFGIVLLVALLGAFVARFRAAEMSVVMAVAGAVYVLLVPIVVMRTDVPVNTREIVLTLVFAGPWLVSAALFRKAAKQG